MYFADLGELWSMSGHGAYVWSAYSIVLLVLASVVWTPIQRQRRVLARVRNRLLATREGNI